MALYSIELKRLLAAALKEIETIRRNIGNRYTTITIYLTSLREINFLVNSRPKQIIKYQEK